jgi:phage terminase small subunit
MNLTLAKSPKKHRKARLPNAPKFLQPQTRAWWRSVVENWELEQHHLRLLTLCASSWDRAEQAREALAEHGLTFNDPKLNRPVARPEVAIERDSRIAFARLLRELDLDTTPASPITRPPGLRSNRR